MTSRRGHRTRFGRLVRSAAVVTGLMLAGAGCAGSSDNATTGPTTSFPYLVNPVDAGTGFVQLGPHRYPFEGVICATGPLKSDPEGSTRIFGVYANFRLDGTLAAVSLTRYRNAIHGKIDSVPTITDTALVEMQGDKEVRGLAAKRFRIEGTAKWQDSTDPRATTPLIVRTGDRYDAKGRFAPIDSSGSSSTTEGEVVARCPGAATGGTTGGTTMTDTTVDPRNPVASTLPGDGSTTSEPVPSTTSPAPRD